MGTPDDRVWPGVRDLPDYKPTFPSWNAKNLGEVVTNLSNDGIDLLKVTTHSGQTCTTPVVFMWKVLECLFFFFDCSLHVL